MRRIIYVLTVALVMVAMLVAMAAPAFAKKNGPLVGTDLTGEAACTSSQFHNNPINPQPHCAKQ